MDSVWPRAALFDLDGTLIDSVPDITLAVAELMAVEGLAPFSESDVRVMVGHGLRVLVRRALQARGQTPNPAEFEAVIDHMLEIYPRHLTGRTTLLPGVVECLDALAAADCAVAVVCITRSTVPGDWFVWTVRAVARWFGYASQRMVRKASVSSTVSWRRSRSTEISSNEQR